MTYERKFVFLLPFLSLLILQGCDKKKHGLPAQMQAPTVAVALPDEIPLAEVPEEPAQPAPRDPNPPPPSKAKPKKTTRTSTNTAKKSPPPANSPAAAPQQQQQQQPPTPGTQTVASLRPPHNPAAEGAPENALAAAIPTEQVMHQKEDTTRMVDSTENLLKGLNRSLNDDEKAMRSQIQSYLQQSRKATADGDYERAYNLAKKAQLLADALTKK